MSKYQRAYLPRVISLIAAIIVVGLALTQANKVQSDDPDSDNSTYMASGPVLDAQTLADNRATADAIEQQEQQNRDWAVQHPESLAPKTPQMAPPTSQPNPTAVAGIYSDLQTPMGWSTAYDIKNAWLGAMSWGNMQVYAGLKSDEVGRFASTGAGQGVIAVVVFPSEASTNLAPQGGEYLTPTRSGPVNITAFSGTCLSLASTTTSAQWSFDVATRQWGCPINH